MTYTRECEKCGTRTIGLIISQNVLTFADDDVIYYKCRKCRHAMYRYRKQTFSDESIEEVQELCKEYEQELEKAEVLQLAHWFEHDCHTEFRFLMKRIDRAHGW